MIEETSRTRPVPLTGDDETGTLFGWTFKQWLTAFAVAMVITLFVTARNYYLYHLVDRPLPFWVVFVAEVPIWMMWLLLMPLVIWLARRFPPVGPRMVRNAGVHLVTGLLASFIPWFAMVLVRSRLPAMQTLDPRQPGFLSGLWRGYVGVSLGFLFMYGMAVGLVLAWTYNRAEGERRSREATLQAMLARAERDLLRAQIHPHFLFNTLNTISALLAEDPKGARRMVVRLSDLLRLSLDDDVRHEVTVHEELTFLAHYVEIQLIRFKNRLTVKQNVSADALPLMLPRLLLQPLVENAIQHGIAQREGRGCIWITGTVAAGKLILEIADNGLGPGQALTHSTVHSGGGLGLTNSRARLRQLYGPAARLDLNERPEGGAIVRVELPAHESPVTIEP